MYLLFSVSFRFEHDDGRYGHRHRFGWPCTTVVILFLISHVTSDDWTASCPENCVCKWTNGKKSVICNTLQLTSIPTTLSTEIQVLVLNENRIAHLNREEFTSLGLINLQRIFLKKSNLVYINQDAFKNLKILVELDLSDNAIETLDKNTFNGNDRLRILYLSGNPLKKLLAHQFPVLPHLRSLDLHNCQLSSIDPAAFANLELLESVNLKNNLLESLSDHVFQYMRNLNTLLLEGNPWNCNCKLRKFRNWYIKSNLNSINLLCSSPNVLRNKEWQAIEEIQFGCPPTVEVFSDDLFNVDIGSNVTFSCLIYGDPPPVVTWELNGRDIVNDNILTEDETDGDRQWQNITIFNITNYDTGVYVCTAKNDVGQASRNVSIYLTEIVQHVIEKGPETFWYFGLILGTFGTVFCLIIISFMICVCKKSSQRRRTTKNIKGSISFNDQEKKLLDLSITTNDRQDSSEIVNTPSTAKTESVIALEPVQITIENLSRNNDEFPLNVGVFPPPPEFCSSVVPNPAYGNIFISVALTQDAIDNPEQMYPDLLNIPNRVIGKLFPINVSSYATLPRNRNQRGPTAPADPSKSSHLQNVINYQNLETSHLNESGSISLCAGCLKNQDSQYADTVASTSLTIDPSKVKAKSFKRPSDLKSTMYPKYDNVGRRITATGAIGGASALSIPDEEAIESEISFMPTTSRKVAGSVNANNIIVDHAKDGKDDKKTDLQNTLLLPSGSDYVSL